MTAARFSRCADTRQWSLLHTSLNPLWLALCWNSHRLSKQSNSGSIHPSIGGIETELVVSRGQEILTGALCRLLAGGCMHAHIYTDCTAEDLVWWEPRILVKARIQIYEQIHSPLPPCISASLPTPTEATGLLGTQTTSTPTHRRSSHTSRFRSCLLKSEQSASSLSQSEGIQSASAAEYQAGCRHVSSRSTDTVDSSALFMGTDEMASHWGLDFYSPKLYGGWRTCDTFNNCLSSAKMTTWGTRKGREL